MSNFEIAKQLFFDGLGFLEKKNYLEAETNFLKSLELVPDRVSTLINLAAVQIKLKKYDEARTTVTNAISLDRENSEAWLNLGIIEKKNDNPNHAIECFDKAIQLKADYAEAWYNKGATLYGIRILDEALVHFDQAIRIKPDYARAYYLRGMSCLLLKKFTQAATSLELAINHNYENVEQVNFVLASLRGSNHPAAPPKEYIADLFDEYAVNFDAHLVNDLKYRAHNVLYDKLKGIIGDHLDVLDAGCGTGLMGELLKPHAKTLTGIDVSGKMLEEARAKNIYDHVYQSDLNEFLQSHAENFDLVAATDVFIYIGELSDVFSNAQRALKKGGYFSFTVERLEAGAFVLNTTLRYSHSAEYCENLAKRHNFIIVSKETNAIRQENGVDMPGYYFVMRKM